MARRVMQIWSKTQVVFIWNLPYNNMWNILYLAAITGLWMLSRSCRLRGHISGLTHNVDEIANQYIHNVSQKSGVGLRTEVTAFLERVQNSHGKPVKM
jgi:hypothetical protein